MLPYARQRRHLVGLAAASAVLPAWATAPANATLSGKIVRIIVPNPAGARPTCSRGCSPRSCPSCWART